MSFEYYINWWIKSRKQFEDLYRRDEVIRSKKKKFDNRWLANDLVAGLYAKYCMLVQELDNCLDQLAQPQKKAPIRKLVSAAVMRLLEFNDQLREIDISEYHYIDGQLVELKLVPYNVEILHPYLMFPRPFDLEDLVEKYRNKEIIYEPPPPIVEEDLENPPLEPAAPVEPEVPMKKASSRAIARKRSSVRDLDGSPSKMLDDGSSPSVKNVIEQKSTHKIGEKRKSKLTFKLTPQVEGEKGFRDFVMLIQTAERGRQTRLYFLELYKQRQRTRPLLGIAANAAAAKPPDPEKQNKAAVVIQKAVRGWETREMMKFRELQRRYLIGMYEPSWRSRKEYEIFEANIMKRRKYRDQKMRDYIDSIAQEKARVLRVVGPGLLEDIGDEIREWFRVWYKEAKCFDKFPPESKGGTILVVRGETMTPKEFIDEVERKRREKAKKGKDNKEKEKQKLKELAAKKKKEEADRKKKEAEKKKKEEAAKKKKKKKGEFEFEFSETKTKEPFVEAEEELREFWDERNDFENPTEKHYMDVITEKECYLLQLQIRKEADELMRIELELLEAALLADKGKKAKKKKGKKKKGKKKGKKGKKNKDMTSSRTTEDLFQELLDNGIIRTYPKTYMDAFLGDFSYKNTELRYKDEDPPAAMLDVRQAVALNCILPLGIEAMKRPRSVLIVGPQGCGKHILANSIFTRTQCVLFDLSPEVTAGKYPGKKGMTMLLHLVNKMARLFQPSVIFLDAAEKLFYKKVPAEMKELEPKRLGGKLQKGIVKTIKPQDRVLLLGLTSQPWAAKGNMKKVFDKVILMPRPDYGSVYMYWKEILRLYHGVDRFFNISCLATMTKYFSYARIKDVVEHVLTPRRIIQLKYKPLKPEELFEYIVSNQIEGVTDKEWKKFMKFYGKTALGRDRNQLNRIIAKIKEKEAKANQNKNR